MYNPSLTLLPNGDLLFFYLRYHCLDYDKPLSSSGCLRRSRDGGRSWNHIENLEDDPGFEFSNVACTFTSRGEAVITYYTSKMEDPAPPGRFGRHRMSLKAAIVQIDRLYE